MVPPLESVERTGIQHFPSGPFRLLRPDVRGRWVRFGEPFGRHDGPRKSALVVVALLGGAHLNVPHFAKSLHAKTRVYGNEWYASKYEWGIMGIYYGYMDVYGGYKPT